MKPPTPNPTTLQQMRESQSNRQDVIIRRTAPSESQNLRNYGSTNNPESNESVQNSTKSFFSPGLQQEVNDESNTSPVQVSSDIDDAEMSESVPPQEHLTQLIPPQDLYHLHNNEPVMKEGMRFILLLLFLLFSCLVVCV